MYQRPIPNPVPSAAIHNVDIAGSAPVRSETREAAQNAVANSEEIVAKKPIHAIQNFAPSSPLCFGADKSRVSSIFPLPK